MRFVAIIQVRAGSTRLPGKNLMELLPGKTMTECLVERVKRVQRLDDICLAFPATGTPVDWKFLEIAYNTGVSWYCSLDIAECDLIGRHLAAAKQTSATHIVRIPGDNPCVDPFYVDVAIEQYRNGHHVFYTNTTADVWGFGAVDGIGAEVFSVNRLQLAYKLATPCEKEHLHTWFDHNGHIIDYQPAAKLRVDVNTQADFDFVKRIYDHFGNTNFNAAEMVAAVEEIERERQQESPQPAV